MAVELKNQVFKSDLVKASVDRWAQEREGSILRRRPIRVGSLVALTRGFVCCVSLSVLFAVTYGVWHSQPSFEPAASPLRSVQSLAGQKSVDVAQSRVLGLVRERPLRSRDQLHRVRLGVSHLHRRLERGGR